MPGREDDEQRWRGRPVLAGLLRAAIVLVPVLLAAAVTTLGARALPRSSGAAWWALHGLVFAASVLTALVAERLARRLLPVAMLLQLTLLFPDRAPSRFKVARKANAVRLLEESAARTDDAGAATTASAVLTLLAALTSHDKRTRGHAERVRVYAELLGEQLNLSPRDRDLLRWGALLHDIGKLEVEASLLNKAGKPTDREWAMLRSHPQRGVRLAAALMPWLGEWGGSIAEHHERYDGTGYPLGLVGSGISRAGRLIAVVDAYEVMTAARSYKRAMSTMKARQELADCAGTHFDPLMVKAFLSVSLPRLLWATGPLSFLVQLPFIGLLRDAGGRAAAGVGSQTVSVAGAAVLATAGTVVGSVVGPQAALAESPVTATAPPPVHAGAERTRPAPGPVAVPAGLTDRPPAGHRSAEPPVAPSRPGSGGPVADASRRVVVHSAPAAEQAGSDATVTFAVMGGGGAECRIDDGAWGSCTSPLRLQGLSEGPHTVAIRPAVGGPATTVSWRTVADASPAPTPAPPERGEPDAPPTSSPTAPPTSSPTAPPTSSPGPPPAPAPDTTAPRVSITSGPPALTASSDATVTFDVDDSSAVVTCAVDGGPADACVNSWSATGLVDGEHTLRIRAVDPAGNTSVVSRTWTVDTSRPVLQVHSGPAARTASRSASITWTTNAHVTVSCSLDGAPAATCASPFTATGLADGPHTLTLTATNRVGTTTTVTRTWTVDSVAPVLVVTAGPPPLTRASSASISWSVDDPSAEVTCSFDGGRATPCTGTWTRTGLADGAHRLVLVATDATGNASTVTHTWTIDSAAPALRVDSGPDAVTSATTAAVSWTAEAGATVTCSFDGAAATACASPWTASGLADGSHSLVLVAVDAAGNTSTVTRSWTVDTVAPILSVTAGPAPATRSTSATVHWTAEAGASVTCSLDGAGSTTCPAPWSTTGLADGVHVLTLTATDAAGNATTVSRTWTVDTTPPALRVTAAPRGTSGRDVTVAFTVDDASATVACSLNGQPATDCTGGTWTGTHLGGGTQRLVLTATDALGNTTSTTQTWTVDTSAPNILLTSGPAAVTADTSATIAFSVDDAAASVVCSVDGAAATACTSPLVLSGLADGSHTVRVTATDSNGNTSTADRTWTVDTVAPVLTLTSAPPARTNATRATVAFTVDDPSATVTCSLDGGEPTACTSPWTASGLAQGTHRLLLTITDAAGNSTSLTRTWTVDTVAPVLTLTGAPASITADTSASFAFSVDDASAAVTCSLDGAAATTCTSPWSVTGLAAGRHTVTLRAVDAAGNAAVLTQAWQVDRSVPTVSIASGPTVLLFTTYFDVTGPSGTSFECRWDNGGWEACGSSPSRAVGSGNHTFSVRGYGANGLRGPVVTTNWFALL